MERQKGEEIWWARLNSTSHEEDAQEITHEVDAILGICGINPARWIDHFVSRSPRRGWDDTRYEQDIAQLRENPQPLGRYLIETAYDELDIEGDEQDDLQLEVQLETPGGKQLILLMEAQFWTDYVYDVPATDPRTDQELIEDNIDYNSMIAYELTLRIEA